MFATLSKARKIHLSLKDGKMDTMSTFLAIAQIIVSILLTGAILLQAQGTGLGSSWGGGGETYHTKRGVEKVVFGFTGVAIVVFVILSIANIMYRN